MSDVTTIRDLIRDLEPLHVAMARFEKGGKQRARDIERIHDALVSVLDEVEGGDEREAELDEREAELDEREDRLEALARGLEARSRAKPAIVAPADKTP